MKVAHFCTTDFGGAYKAAARINEAMRLCGADSDLFVRTKIHEDSDCRCIIDTPVKSLVSKSKNLLNLMLSENEIISDVFGTDITKLDAVRQADAVILHWVNSFVSYDTVKKLADSKKRIIWVMHDMWPYTGGCHSDFDCRRYEEGCGNCPMLKKGGDNDISRRNFLKKCDMFKDSGIIIVSPSHWNLECAKKSRVTEGLKKYVIHNPLDTSIFCPKYERGKGQAKKRILFGAMGQSVHKWEGIGIIREAIGMLPDDLKGDIELVVFGNNKDPDLSDMGIEVKSLGYIHGDEELARLYALADVFVSPSVADNYPNTLLEAICCGTPCVCFDIGGMPDLVKTGQTGYLAKAKDAADMSEGIRYVLTGSLKEKLSNPATNPNLDANSYQTIGSLYIHLCESGDVSTDSLKI